ncbi:MAG: serine protease [Acetobacteraceae bacterium]|nr:serine protease [Acetobacteraceae bacterium]
MADIAENPLIKLSEALAERVRLARPLVAGIAVPGHRIRSGTLWRKDVVVASEQRFPDTGDAKVTLADGIAFTARVAGRDPGTNIIALRLEGTPDPAPLAAGEPQPGGLALALGADDGGIAVRLGVVHSVAPAWHSRAGGRIDRRITLDIDLTPREEGGPVLDPSGGLLGISTLGPRGRVLVIPASTVEAVLEPMLSKGRVERGWLGLALQPVLVPEALQDEAGQSQGLMVMSLSKDGPAARANLHAGDILVQIAGESVTSPRAVAQYLGPDSVGRQVELYLIRAGKPVSIAVTVGVRPDR